MKAYDSQISWNQQNSVAAKTAENSTNTSSADSTIVTISNKDDSKKNFNFKNLSITLVEGYLTGKPSILETKTGSQVSNFSIALNYGSVNGEPNVTYLDIETWGKKAEACNKFLDKGSRIIAQGYLRQDRWENTKGEKRSKIKLVADSITFLPKVTAKKEA